MTKPITTKPTRHQMIDWLKEADIIPMGTSTRRMIKFICEALNAKR